MSKEIKRLKVEVIKKNGLIVTQSNGTSGFIHISEVSHGFVEDLNDYFQVGDTIYGVRTKTHYGKNYYSLKCGHTMSKNVQKRFKVRETGGGYLGIIYQQELKLNKQKRRSND